jgi:integrase
VIELTVFWREEAGRPGRWVLSYKRADGKWKQKAVPKEIRGKRDADAWARAWLAGASSRVPDAMAASEASEASETVGALVDKWLTYRKELTRIKRSTWMTERSYLVHQVIPHLGALPVAGLDIPTCRAFVRELSRAWAPSTVHGAVKTLAMAIDDASSERWFRVPAKNPLRDKEVRRELPVNEPQREEIVIVPLESAQALLDCASVPLHRRVRYAIGLLAGLRDGEIAGLLVGDVELDAPIPVMHVRRSVSGKGPDGWATASSTKTRASRRTVPLHPALVAALRVWITDGIEVYTTRQPAAESPLFPGPRTGRFSRPPSAELTRADLERAGCPTSYLGIPIDFHATRRTFSTWLDEAGVTERRVQRLLGHTSKSIAGKHYTGAELATLLEDVKKLPLRWAAASLLPPAFATAEGTRETETIPQREESAAAQPWSVNVTAPQGATESTAPGESARNERGVFTLRAVESAAVGKRKGSKQPNRLPPLSDEAGGALKAQRAAWRDADALVGRCDEAVIATALGVEPPPRFGKRRPAR